MPIYEYVCENCNQKFEMIRSIKESDASTPCVHCGGLNIHRAVSTCFSHTGSGSGYTPPSSHASGGCGGCSGGSCGSCRH